MTTPHTPEDTTVEEMVDKIPPTYTIKDHCGDGYESIFLDKEDVLIWVKRFVTTYGEAKKAEERERIVSALRQEYGDFMGEGVRVGAVLHKLNALYPQNSTEVSK